MKSLLIFYIYIPINCVLVIGLYQLLDPKTLLIEPPGPGLDINVCPVPVKTDVGQVDLVSWLSDGTSEKILSYLLKVIFYD